MQREYYARNEKLENKDKIFSTKYLVKILEEERTQKLEELKQNNKILEPKEFIKQKTLLENEYTVLNKIIAGLEDENTKKESIINVQKEFLETFANRIEKSTDKNELEKMIYAFRYYCLLPFFKSEIYKRRRRTTRTIKKGNE